MFPLLQQTDADITDTDCWLANNTDTESWLANITDTESWLANITVLIADWLKLLYWELIG